MRKLVIILQPLLLFSGVTFSSSSNFQNFVNFYEIVDYSNKYIYGSNNGYKENSTPNIEDIIKSYINIESKKIIFSNIGNVNTSNNTVYIVPVRSKKLSMTNAFVKKFRSSYVIFYFPKNNSKFLDIDFNNEGEKLELLGLHLFIITHELGHVISEEEGSFVQHGCSKLKSKLLDKIKLKEDLADNFAFEKINNTLPSFDGKQYDMKEPYGRNKYLNRAAFLAMQAFFRNSTSRFSEEFSDILEADELVDDFTKKLIKKVKNKEATYADVKKVIKMHEMILESNFIKSFRSCSTHGSYHNRVFSFAEKSISKIIKEDITKKNNVTFSILIPKNKNIEEIKETYSKLIKSSKDVADLLSKKYTQRLNKLNEVYNDK